MTDRTLWREVLLQVLTDGLNCSPLDRQFGQADAPVEARHYGRRHAEDQRLLIPVPAPYSPDLNPIEMAVAKLKAHLRRLEAKSFEGVVEALGSICAIFKSTECENYFRAAGYAPN